MSASSVSEGASLCLIYREVLRFLTTTSTDRATAHTHNTTISGHGCHTNIESIADQLAHQTSSTIAAPPSVFASCMLPPLSPLRTPILACRLYISNEAMAL